MHSFERDLDGTRCSADEMDEKRAETIAYEYLCRLEETKKWIESCTGDVLPESIHLEEVVIYLFQLFNYLFDLISSIKSKDFRN